MLLLSYFVWLLPTVTNGLVPLSHVESMNNWISTDLSKRETFDGVVLRPRLRSRDTDPYMLGVMESKDVPGVAKVIAESFSNLVVSPGSTWENAVLDGVANIVTAYDVSRSLLFRLSLTRCRARRSQSTRGD